MSENKTPVIGHVTPLADAPATVTVRLDEKRLARIDAARAQTRGYDGLLRPGPAVDVDNCPSNEWRIRRQCTRTPCMTLGEPPPAMHDLDAGEGARSWMSIPSLDPSGLKALNWLIQFAKPRYFFHGHTHFYLNNIANNETITGNTRIVNTCIRTRSSKYNRIKKMENLNLSITYG